MDVDSETSKSLAELRAAFKVPIAQELVEIARLQTPRPTPPKTLECLSLVNGPDHEPGHQQSHKRQRVANGQGVPSDSKPRLSRHNLDLASKNPEYVVVSWTWTRPADEDPAVAGYKVQSRSHDGGFIDNTVQNAVLSRALRYAATVDCPYIWIDKECINQYDTVEKELAIQSMDLVYSRCRHAIALLSVHISSEDELGLLKRLLDDEIIVGTSNSQDFTFRLEETAEESADSILCLLERITSDSWWTRAWTFQEDYKAGIKMDLLIPYAHSLETSSFLSDGTFGHLPGELCINSADFRFQATRFCLAYKNHFGPSDACDNVMNLAGKYTELLRNTGLYGGGISRSMSPTIFSNISKRGITEPADRLAIAANCCSYTTRLDTQSLLQQGRSLSLGMLTLFLLNGEIIDNDDDAGKLPGALSETVFGFLKRQSFDRFEAPGRKELQFFKGCRFPRVDLTAEGIKTQGYLWRAGKLVYGKPMVSQGRQSSFRRGLSSLQKQQLSDFAEDLEERVYGRSYRMLAQDIRQYLDGSRGKAKSSYMDLMAGEIIEAIQAEQPLDFALAVGLDAEDYHGSYRAIFVRSRSPSDIEEETDGGEEGEEVYYFTAEAGAHPDTGDIARHVSLVVEKRGSTPDGLPELFIKGWADALCFPDPENEQEVVFPWPTSLIV